MEPKKQIPNWRDSEFNRTPLSRYAGIKTKNLQDFCLSNPFQSFMPIEPSDMYQDPQRPTATEVNKAQERVGYDVVAAYMKAKGYTSVCVLNGYQVYSFIEGHKHPRYTVVTTPDALERFPTHPSWYPTLVAALDAVKLFLAHEPKLRVPDFLRGLLNAPQPE